MMSIFKKFKKYIDTEILYNIEIINHKLVKLDRRGLPSYLYVKKGTKGSVIKKYGKIYVILDDVKEEEGILPNKLSYTTVLENGLYQLDWFEGSYRIVDEIEK